MTTQGLGVLAEGSVYLLDLPDMWFEALARQHDDWRHVISSADVRATVPIEEVQFRSIVSPASTVWIVGTNYDSKLAVTGRPRPLEPYLALKSAAAITGHECDVELPKAYSQQVDFEGEVAVVLDKAAHDVPVEHAWRCVAGLVAANDVTCRDLMDGGRGVARAKSFPGFLPLGGVLATPDEFPDPDRVGFDVHVNGQVRQTGNTSQLIFPVPDIIARLSQVTTLLPGDVVLTGSPAGSGQDDGRFLESGDQVQVRLDGLPALSNQFV